MKIVSRRYHNSSSFKMASLFTVLLGMAALLLGYFLYDFGTQNFTRETEALIDGEMEHILSVVSGKHADGISRYIAEQAKQKKHPIYILYDQAGNVLAGNIPTLPQKILRIKEGVLSFEVSLEGENRMVASKIHTFQDGSRLLIARDIHAITQSYQKLKWITACIIFFMLIVVSVSYFISLFVVGRINIIAQTAQQIMDTGDLSQRISIHTSWDDLSNLAQILNALLDRIEVLMQGIRDVSDSIAHDLRIPLTRLRNELENAQNTPLTCDDAERLIADADQLLGTFNSLLRISNIEKGKRHHAMEKVSLRNILEDVTELYDTFAEERQISIKNVFSPGAYEIPGDKDLLFQLFANILDNAIKFSHDKGEIDIVTEPGQDYLCVTISDGGIGIRSDEKDKVFDRFYRSDTSRNTPGSGLGLSLVKAIADYHKADIILEDNNPGLSVRIYFQASV